jgi:hypothetical protein
MNYTQIKVKVKKLQLEDLAKSSGFEQRSARKIDSVSFVAGFWLMLSSSKFSLNSWVHQISIMGDQVVSKQGLNQRIKKAVRFSELVLSKCLEQSFERLDGWAPWWQQFKHVYIQDSSCLSLPKCLADAFPGSVNNSGQNATARIQLCFDLLSGQYHHLELKAFRNNDQSHSAQILPLLQAGDLIIRDLGYWSLKVFAQIIKKQAYMLSRLRYKVFIYNTKGEKLDLDKALVESHKKGRKVYRKKVLVGAEMKVPMTLVAIKTPAHVADQRKKKAKENRDKRLKPDASYYNRLEWTIFITNAPKVSYKHLLKAYGIRWQIEIIFKTWKSEFDMTKLFDRPKTLNVQRVKVSFYLFLAFQVYCNSRWQAFWQKMAFQKQRTWLSTIKLASFIRLHFARILAQQHRLEVFNEQVIYYCAYESRHRKHALMTLINPLT